MMFIFRILHYYHKAGYTPEEAHADRKARLARGETPAQIWLAIQAQAAIR